MRFLPFSALFIRLTIWTAIIGDQLLLQDVSRDGVNVVHWRVLENVSNHRVALLRPEFGRDVIDTHSHSLDLTLRYCRDTVNKTWS